ncbi:unnamed protein product, partial [Larinioides sclopetarius]
LYSKTSQEDYKDYARLPAKLRTRVSTRPSPYALLLTLQGRLDVTSAQIWTQGGKNIVEIQEQTF